MNHTVDILGESDRTLSLIQALLFYRSRQGDVYATSHGIDIDPEQPHRKIITAGVALSKASLAEFAGAVSAATEYSGFVPDNLVYSSPNLLAWWVPATVRTSWFRSEGEEIVTAHGPVAHPALVFVTIPGDWFVFALRDSARPGPTTKLCHSPHFNVWDGGRICTGNVDLPAAPSAQSMLAYEAAFFRSRFTHPNRKRAVKYSGGMVALWRDQLARPDPAAMRKALVSAGETLQAAITRISKFTTKQR